MLIGVLDGIGSAVLVVGLIVVVDSEVRPGLGPDVIRFRRMYADARVHVIGCVGNLLTDAGRPGHEAVDERRIRIHEDLLRRGHRRRLNPVVILHCDHEHRAAVPIAPLVFVIVVGARCQTAPPQRDGDRHRAPRSVIRQSRHVFLLHFDDGLFIVGRSNDRTTG
jgi:hypothetical protein